MLQAKYLMTAVGLCVAGVLVGSAVQAEDILGAYQIPDPPAVAGDSGSSPAVNNAAESTSDVAQAEPLACPPGQFPSAFADVYPFHWAYQAVNNLASPSMRCFDLPEEFR